MFLSSLLLMYGKCKNITRKLNYKSDLKIKYQEFNFAKIQFITRRNCFFSAIVHTSTISTTVKITYLIEAVYIKSRHFYL